MAITEKEYTKRVQELGTRIAATPLEDRAPLNAELQRLADERAATTPEDEEALTAQQEFVEQSIQEDAIAAGGDVVDGQSVEVPPPSPSKKKKKSNSKKKPGFGNNKGACAKEPNKPGTRRYRINEMNELKAQRTKALKVATTAAAKANAEKDYANGVSHAKKRFKRNKHKYVGLAGCDPSAAVDPNKTEQSFIMDNFDKFTNKNQGPSPASLGSLIQVKSNGGNLLNTLTLSRNLGPLFNASSFELSQLTPYIRIYKRVTYDPTEVEPDPDTGIASALREFRFQGHLRSEDLMKSKSSYSGGIGFKSFRWHTTGTNLYTGPRMLTATLSLYFQTVVDMNESAGTGSKAPKWYELLIQQGASSPAKQSSCPTDSVELRGVNGKRRTLGAITAEDKKNSESGEESGDIDFETTIRASPPDVDIIAKVGWEYSDRSEMGDDLKDAINRSRLVLTLSYYNHDIKFAEDGSVTVDISYTASIDNAMSSYGANLFNLDENGLGSDQFKAYRDLEEKIAEREHTIDSPAGAFSCAYDAARTNREKDRVEKDQEKAEKELDKLKEKLEGTKRRLKSSIYGKFIQHLMINEKLYSIKGDIEDYNAGSFESFAAGKTGTAAAPELLEGDLEDTQRRLEQTVDDVRQVNAEKLTTYVSNALDQCADIKDGEMKINFFYFGDLVNFYAKALPARGGNNASLSDGPKKYEIVLGDLTYLSSAAQSAFDAATKPLIDQLTGLNAMDEMVRQEGKIWDELQEKKREKLGELQDATRNFDFSSYTKSVNLANVPISLDLYTQWFTDAVTNGEDVFTFKRFLQEITTKLIVESLGPPIESNVRDVKRVMREEKRVRVAIASGISPNLKSGHLVEDIEDAATLESKLLIAPGDGTDLTKEYLLITASWIPSQGRIIDEEENAKKGIYHLKIGADKGIVKNIQFNRESNAAMQTSNIINAYNKGGAALGVLRLPYQATVEVVGNAFFQPGQYIYIDPTTVGRLSRPERLHVARDLIGLGGFYLITKVSSNLESGRFNTTLDCKFEAYGRFPPGIGESKPAGEPLNDHNPQAAATDGDEASIEEPPPPPSPSPSSSSPSSSPSSGRGSGQRGPGAPGGAGVI